MLIKIWFPFLLLAPPSNLFHIPILILALYSSQQGYEILPYKEFYKRQVTEEA